MGPQGAFDEGEQTISKMEQERTVEMKRDKVVSVHTGWRAALPRNELLGATMRIYHFESIETCVRLQGCAHR